MSSKLSKKERFLSDCPGSAFGNDIAICRPYIVAMAKPVILTTTTTTPAFRGRMVAA